MNDTSACPGCETIPQLPARPATLYLTPALAHTRAKVHKRLCAHGSDVRLYDGDVLEVQVGHGRLSGLLDELCQVLTGPELKACRAIVMEPGRPLGLADLGRVRSLHSLVAESQSAWLHDMLRDHRFLMHFQPIVHMDAPEHVFAHECLLRGLDGQGRLVFPDRIFPAARAADLLFHLDREARLTAIRQAAEQVLGGHVFINFNPTAIYDPRFCLQSTLTAARESAIGVERFVFEVIESDSVDDVEHLRRILAFYRDAGLKVALDDLGSGYGSLNLLTQLRPDFVKLDRQLIQGIDQDRYKQKVTGKLLEMAQELGVTTIAEGIETAAEWDWLREAGAHLGQGYLFARPGLPPPVPRRPA